MAKNARKPRKGQGPVCVKWFRHYITGKIYYAEDYGHKAWPIGR